MSNLTISEAAKLKGVSVSTLRRWELEGKIIAERTPTGHRRYDLARLLGFKSELSYILYYCRTYALTGSSRYEVWVSGI
jgi:putative resolvase